MANYVTLTFTVADAGQGAETGSVTIVPTAVVVDAGVTVVSQDPIVRAFSGGAVSVSLFATDNTGTTPAAGFWAYNITLPGWIAPKPYLLKFSDGATQRFDNLTAAVASTTYGPAASGGGFTNPMTTLGDIIYEDATPAAARLAGSTSATKKFLTQTGTGTISAVPGWNTIAAADLPAATTSTQGAVILDGTAADIQPPGVAAAGAKGQAADAKHVHPLQSWQFMPEAYGARGDGKVITDATMTNGSAVLTSASNPFTAGDAGKHIIVNQGAANVATLPLITTIASYQSAGQVTLAAACTSAVASAPAVWGTDDTAAVNAAVSAAYSYATGASGNYAAEIVFADRIYCIAGAPTQTAAAGSVAEQNSQIPIPYPNINNQGRKLILKFTGVADASSNQYWDSIVPNLQGTVLMSFSTAIAGSFGVESVIGGPSNFTGLAGGFVNVKAVIDKITVSVPWGAQGVGFDFRYLAAADVPNASYQAFAAVNLGSVTLGGPWLNNIPTNGQSVGLYMPLINANADSVVGTFTAECVCFGLAGGDHLNVTRASLIYTGGGAGAAVYIPFSSAAIHGAWFGMLTVEAYKGDVILSGGSGLYPLNIGILNIENNLGSGFDINDAGNSFSGTVNWACTDRVVPSVSGAGNLEIINQRQKPRGFITAGSSTAAPGVPGSTTPLVNPFWRHAWVTITGGTVSAIAVDGQATGLTLTTGQVTSVRVPSGKTITLTYSAAPTWLWWVD